MNQERITISQVAREAGVSKQTVSRVLNNRPDVADETRRRVQQIVDALGYQPSSIARSLSRGKSYTLGVVGYGLEYFGPSRLLSGIEKEANQLGYTLLLNLIRKPERSDVSEIINDLLARHVDGIIWAVPEIGDNRAWVAPVRSRLTTPLVFTSTQPRPGLFAVNMDNRLGGRLATEHLIAQGRRRIALITGPLHWWDARERKVGWQEALQAADLSAEENLVVEGDWSAASGERALRQILSTRTEVDAIFASNDQMALGVLRAAHSLGLRVPDDLAVVGFDDIPEAAFFYPSLTTIHQDVVELGRRAVTEFARLVQGQKPDGAGETNAVLLAPRLVERESSRSPQ